MILTAIGGRRWAMGAVLCVLGVLCGGAFVSAQMPDVRQMAGIPRPVTDLPNGSVSVRLIRGDMSNNITNHPVEMHLGKNVQTVNTDGEGRAQFDNLNPGTPVKFVAVVDGERLESEEFPAQSPGGVRLLLVATDKAADQKSRAASVPAVAGSVVIAGESRIVFEPSEETVAVYYVLDIVNGASSPVNPEKPFVFTLPSAAVNTTVIRGSSPLASNKGREVTVAGPFPPGTTSIQVAAEYPVAGGTIEIAQMFPAQLQEPVVVAKKVGAMKLASPQLDRVQESVTEGTAVIIGAGRPLAAGQPLVLTVSGLPHHSGVPRTITLVLAGVIVLVGAWAAVRAGGDPTDRASERKRLVARREKIFQDLVRLEHDHRRGRSVGPPYAARREELVQSLEHIYGALDESGVGPEPASRAGVAA